MKKIKHIPPQKTFTIQEMQESNRKTILITTKITNFMRLHSEELEV